jgi:hypothetical protein
VFNKKNITTMRTNETFEMTAVKANVFERIAGAMWRWWFNVQAKRRARRAAAYSEAYITMRAEL